MASQTLRDGIVRLQEVVLRKEEMKGRAFVLTLSDEQHDIAAKMNQHIMELNGYRVLFSGQRTPAVDAESIFKMFRPDRVLLSSTYVSDVSASQAELDELVSLCERYDAELYAGDLFQINGTVFIQAIAQLNPFVCHRFGIVR